MPRRSLHESSPRTGGPPLAGTRLAVAVLLVSLPAAAGAAAHATGQDPAALRLYQHALSLRDAGNVEGAIQELDLLAQQFPEGELAAGALLEVAQLRLQGGDHEAAAISARRLLAEHPRSGTAAGGALVLAQIAHAAAADPDRLAAAREQAVRIPLLYGKAEYPAIPWRAAALVLAGRISLQLQEPGAAVAALAQALEERVGPSWGARAQAALGEALLAQGDWESAAWMLQRASEADEAAPEEAAESRRLLGLLDRRFLRPAAGRPSWQGARRLQPPGLALQRPITVAVDRRGRVFVGDDRVPAVAILEEAGAVQWQRSPMNPGDRSWFDGRGHAYFTTAGAVIAVPEPVRTTFIGRDRGEVAPVRDIVAGATGAFGRWVLAHDNGDRTSLFEADGTYARSINPPGRSQIVDLTTDGLGRIYVLDRRGGRLLRYTADGEPDGTIVTGQWREARAVALDRLGDVFVLDRGERTIHVYAPDGTPLARLGPALPGGISLDDPRDLAVDPAGRIFVADRGLGALLVIE